MSTCNFPTMKYSPDKDNVVNNVLVKASAPSSSSNQTTSGRSAAHRVFGGMPIACAFCIVGLHLAAAISRLIIL